MRDRKSVKADHTYSVTDLSGKVAASVPRHQPKEIAAAPDSQDRGSQVRSHGLECVAKKLHKISLVAIPVSKPKSGLYGT